MHTNSVGPLGRSAACALALSIALVAAPAHADAPTQTPIKHIVVFFEENQSFDHYFGTYPNAANIPGETSWVGVPAPQFVPRPNTPTVNGLTPELLTNNPNKTLNGAPANPQRLRPMDAAVCSNNHSYTPEQNAADHGLMDKFPQSTAGTGEGCSPDGSTVMDFVDGNTITALWNYANHYAMSDNSFDATFGPTLPGHLNLISGNTHGGILHNASSSSAVFIDPNDGTVTDINNIAGFLDDCGSDHGGTVKAATLEMTGRNVGDLLNAKGVTWGYFQGGFAPSSPAVVDANGNTVTPAACAGTLVQHQMTINGTTYTVPNPTTGFTGDIHTPATVYATGIAPFSHYASTRNPHHLPPSSPAMIGQTDQANHNYDTADFFTALQNGNLPAVSYVKAFDPYTGHPGNSDPLVEQAWLVQGINAVMKSSAWSSTAIIIAWDDSDGWYDHVLGPVLTPSGTSIDALAGPGNCGTVTGAADSPRCGRGPRQPLLVISPYAKTNYVDHTLTDQVSILAFIEQNWDLGFIDGPNPPAQGTGSTDRYAGSIDGMFDFTDAPNLRQLQLDPVTGTVAGKNW
ncbi:MAG TPA: alkaline phosphatase family protein [Aliidongia sp.]|nr:alkaline phosphatase family protein [Aliidongia sp.]